MSDADLPAGRPPAVWPSEQLVYLAKWLRDEGEGNNAATVRQALAAHDDLVARYTEEKALWRGGQGRLRIGLQAVADFCDAETKVDHTVPYTAVRSLEDARNLCLAALFGTSVVSELEMNPEARIP